MKYLIFIIFYISNTFALKLPDYMHKCSESDPDSNQCIKKKGNIAIPSMVKGDSTYGVPELKFVGDNFKLTLTNIFSDNFKNFRITDVEYDLNDKKAFAVYQTKFLNFSSDYTMDNSKLLSRTIHGSGHFEMSLVNSIITYKADPSTVTKDGDVYLKFSNQEISVTPERCYFSFENIQVDDGGEDINAYINEHWDVVWNAMKPVIGRYFTHYIQVPY